MKMTLTKLLLLVLMSRAIIFNFYKAINNSFTEFTIETIQNKKDFINSNR